MTAWNRRRFLHGLGLAGLAAACKRAPSDEAAASPAPQAKPKPAPPPPPAPGEMIDPGYVLVGRAPIVFDGDGMILLRDGTLVRRDKKFAETGTIALTKVKRFALLPDRSLVVITEDKGAWSAHHVIGAKVVSSRDATTDTVLADGTSKAYWGLSASWAEHVDIATGKLVANIHLPENSDPEGAVTLADGSVVMPSNAGIVRVDKTLTTYALPERPKHLSRGPDPKTLWANIGFESLVLLKLEGDKAVAVVTHALPAGDRLIHLTSNGPLAAGIVAHPTTKTRAAASLVVWDRTKEQWRAALGDEPFVGRFAVLSQSRAAVLSLPSGTVRAWNVATGAPA